MRILLLDPASMTVIISARSRSSKLGYLRGDALRTPHPALPGRGARNKARRSKGELPEAAISNKRTVNERVFCRLKHFRRMLALYGPELTRFTAAVYIAATNTSQLCGQTIAIQEPISMLLKVWQSRLPLPDFRRYSASLNSHS
jgi:transposase